MKNILKGAEAEIYSNKEILENSNFPHLPVLNVHLFEQHNGFIIKYMLYRTFLFFFRVKIVVI